MADNTCPICGEKLRNGVCPDCGGSTEEHNCYPDNNDVNTGNTAGIYTSRRAPSGGRNFQSAEYHTVSTEQAASAKRYALMYIIAVLVPVFGIILGILIMKSAPKDTIDFKSGKILMTVSIVLFVLPVIATLLFGFLPILFEALG